MSDLWERVPEPMTRWKQRGDQARLFGIPTSDMTRDELLAVIGCLGEQMEDARKRSNEMFSLLSDLDQARRGL